MAHRDHEVAVSGLLFKVKVFRNMFKMGEADESVGQFWTPWASLLLVDRTEDIGAKLEDSPGLAQVARKDLPYAWAGDAEESLGGEEGRALCFVAVSTWLQPWLSWVLALGVPLFLVKIADLSSPL